MGHNISGSSSREFDMPFPEESVDQQEAQLKQGLADRTAP